LDQRPKTRKILGYKKEYLYYKEGKFSDMIKDVIKLHEIEYMIFTRSRNIEKLLDLGIST